MSEKDVVKSLEKISNNLVAINDTIAAKKNEEAKPKPEEVDINSLIYSVDKNSEELFKDGDVFRGGLRLTFASMALIVVAVVIILVVNGLILRTLGAVDSVALVLSGFAAIFAFYSFIAQIGDENTVRVRYKRALGLDDFQKKSEDEKIILKALIKIRTKNAKLPLQRIYRLHSEMFTKEKLLEKLYE
ncbi:MAG: hypothetical protein ABR909_07780 [Candidatus Bathyarchaeia archaeon]|jgi:hypothetical protein